MQSYHSSSMPSSGGYSDTDVRKSANPYAYAVVPPVGRLLECIIDHVHVGGCFRPGNRQLAQWLGYAGASAIPYLLTQLACDGWITYDPQSGVITLEQAIDPIDRIDRIDRADREKTPVFDVAIDPIDRFSARPNAEPYTVSTTDRVENGCMVLAAADHESNAAAAANGGDARGGDGRAALLSELGAAPKVIAKALAARPDLTPEQIRASWSHFEPRIKAGLCSAGAFFAAIADGQLHSAPPDPHRPIAPEAYAGDPLFRMGGDVTGLDAPPAGPAGPAPNESPYDEAGRILPEGAPAADRAFVACRLACGDDSTTALATLAAHRRRR